MLEEYTAVIQAGGKGTRMRALTHDLIPKPMLCINGKPMLEHQIEAAVRYGITEFIIIVGHLGEKIKEYFGDGKKFHVHILYIEESEPLGSAGALGYLKDLLQTHNFFLFYSDVMFDVHLPRMAKFHEQCGGMATLLLHPNAHPQDSDLMVLDGESRIIGLDDKKNVRDYWYDNCVNAGIFLMSTNLLHGLEKGRAADMERDLLMPFIKQGKVFGYRTPEYVKDAGTPTRFSEVAAEQAAGVWRRKNLENKQQCVFMDRDGTINQYRGLISCEDDFVLEAGAAEAIRKLNKEGYLAIVVTNQPVVARGMCGENDVRRIHQKMQVLLGNEGAYLDDIVFCPHHPDKGYPEENPDYKIVCQCRKPATGMIDNMVEKYNIDKGKSFIIGDTTVDIKTGRNAGLKTLLLSSGQGGRDKKYKITPDGKANDLLEGVELILRGDV